MLEEAQDIPKITEQETPTERKPQARTQERRKKKEAPRYAANTVGKQDSIPLDATAQLKDSSA